MNQENPTPDSKGTIKNYWSCAKRNWEAIFREPSLVHDDKWSINKSNCSGLKDAKGLRIHEFIMI